MVIERDRWAFHFLSLFLQSGVGSRRYDPDQSPEPRAALLCLLPAAAAFKYCFRRRTAWRNTKRRKVKPEKHVHSARRLDNVLGMSSRRAEWTRILADFVRIVLEARFPIRI